MPIKDNKSNTNVLHFTTFSLAAGAATVTNALDVRNFDNGITFFVTIYSSDDIGNTVSILSFEESANGSVWSLVSPENYIGDITDVQNITITENINNVVGSIGLFGVERYIRINYSADAGNTGVIGGSINANLGIEIKPGEL